MRAARFLPDWLEVWLVWVFVTGLGWCVGLVIMGTMVRGADPFLVGKGGWMVGGAMAGALIGLVQRQILRPEVKGDVWWTLATAAGWMVGLAMTAVLLRVTGWTWARAMGTLPGGFVLGLAQWLALRPEAEGKAGWVLGTAVGWAGALTLGITLAGGTSPGIFAVHIVEIVASGAVGWVVIGLVAILVLVWLFPGPQRKYATYVRWWP